MPPYSFTGAGTTIAAAQLGANSKMYYVPFANIGADNDAAIAHASLAQLTLSSKHVADPGARSATVEGLQLTGGMDVEVAGIPEPKLSFHVKALVATSNEATELNMLRVAWLTKAPIWLASLTNAEDVPGAYGLMGLWVLTATEKKDTNNEVIGYDVEAKPALTATHLPEPYQVPA